MKGMKEYKKSEPAGSLFLYSFIPFIPFILFH